MKKKFVISIKRYVINLVIDRASLGDISQYNYGQKLSSEKLEVLGVDFPDEPLAIQDKHFSEVFSYRLRASVELALQLKVIKSQQFAFNLGGSDVLTSKFVVTRIGRIYRQMPSFGQMTVLFIASLVQRLVTTTNRFKWLSGLISFAILSVKVWQSGVIDKLWIGFSAILGLAMAALISTWR